MPRSRLLHHDDREHDADTLNRPYSRSGWVSHRMCAYSVSRMLSGRTLGRPVLISIGFAESPRPVLVLRWLRLGCGPHSQSDRHRLDIHTAIWSLCGRQSFDVCDYVRGTEVVRQSSSEAVSSVSVAHSGMVRHRYFNTIRCDSDLRVGSPFEKMYRSLRTLNILYTWSKRG